MQKIFSPLPLNLNINKTNNTTKNYNFLINPFFKFLFKYSLKNFNSAAEDL